MSCLTLPLPRCGVRSAGFLVLFATLSACDTSATHLGGQDCEDTYGQAVLGLLNEARAAEGLPALTVDVRLIQSASRHSTDMAGHNMFSHTGTDGSSASVRVREAGYEWTHVAENIAAGQPNPASVVTAWLNSPGHRANILSSRAQHIGVGYVSADQTQYGSYWTVNFGATAGDVWAPSGGCHP